jgi:hypothetical protein
MPHAARALLLATLLALLSTRPAAAHQQGRSYCTVQTVPGGADVVLETAVEHLAPVLGSGGAPLSDAAVLASRSRLESMVGEQLTARTPSGPCQATVGELELVDRDGERRMVIPMQFFCADGAITIENKWRLAVEPTSEIVCAIDGSAWAFRRGAEQRNIGTPPSLTAVMGSFVVSGAEHVMGGLDHVLFVVALLVAAALAATTTWSGLVAVAGIVTGFTLGHSVTLLAAGLGLVALEPRFTESVIALSIVYVGLENVFGRAFRFRTLTACLFGLVHGFGFAAVLQVTELPARGAVWALLSFNVGIELAQLAIVALIFPALALAARRSWYRRAVLVPLSLAVVALASAWFVKRAAGVEFLPWLGS